MRWTFPHISLRAPHPSAASLLCDSGESSIQPSLIVALKAVTTVADCPWPTMYLRFATFDSTHVKARNIAAVAAALEGDEPLT